MRAITLGILGLVFLAAACQPDPSHKNSFVLEDSPDYEFSVYETPLNECWPPANPLPIPLEVIPWPLEIASTTTSLLLGFVPIFGFQVFPRLEGHRVDRAIGAYGAVNPLLVMSTSCAYASTGLAVGELTGDSEIDLDLSLTFYASADVDGPVVSCAAFEGESLDIDGFPLPLPTLSDPVDGSCQLRMSGLVSLDYWAGQ